MSLRRVSAADAIARLDDGAYGAVIDARSESEFALDRLPGAVNWPSLDDAERAAIGTMYREQSPFAARKHGAVRVARNVARHVERHVLGLDRDWRPLIYCWRGGQRSAALATVLDAIGFSVSVLDGGYQAFRREVLAQLDALPPTLELRVLCGRTGSAKTALLRTLAAHGAQVLDLEALAAHRGSVLGPEPGRPQPSQKAFETTLWHVLRGFDPSRPVFTEGESRTIGRLRLPEALLQRLRAAPCLKLQMPLAARVHFLLDDYAHFVRDTSAFTALLQRLVPLRGRATVERWLALAAAGELPTVVRELLEQHYDPIYERSMQRNFTRLADAPPIDLADAAPARLAAAAAAIVERAA